MKKYQGNFENWADVQSQYGMTEAEPDEVILAEYDCEQYEGRSYVVFRCGRKYYLNYGSHCSCYGLEECWEPIEYKNKTEFLANLRKAPLLGVILLKM